VSQRAAERVAVCVFSGLSGRNAGGVQGSGQVAWRAVVEHARAVGGSAGLLVYGEAEEAELRLGGVPSFASASRWGFLRTTALRRWDTPLVCFWHLDLLRLLPLLRLGSGEVVLFLHGIEAWRRQGWLSRRLLSRVDRFLCNSRFTWRRFLEFEPRFADRPHSVVPLGIGEPVTTAPPPPDDVPTVLMLGRLQRGEDYKGHREIIGAWPRVRARVPSARLWIAGDGDLRPDLEALAASCGVADAVRFWGRVSEGQKQELLRRSRCLAMPSRGEGFGLVYLEAMRLGRPCLVSPHDAAREVVAPPEAGLAADPGRPEELCETLVQLLTVGPEWLRLSRDARRRYESDFTAEHFQRRLVAALFGQTAARTA
jgi:phosphatidyl-myo-inositol dimannoside synthase